MKYGVIHVTEFLEDDKTYWPEIYKSLCDQCMYAPANISAPIWLEFNNVYTWKLSKKSDSSPQAELVIY